MRYLGPHWASGLCDSYCDRVCRSCVVGELVADETLAVRHEEHGRGAEDQIAKTQFLIQHTTPAQMQRENRAAAARGVSRRF
jgi:hypothetical protein